MSSGYPLQPNDGRHCRMMPLLDRRAGPHRPTAAGCGR